MSRVNQNSENKDRLNEEANPFFNSKKIPPESVICRLPKYYRILKNLISRDVYRISSKRLAQEAGASASQIRSDLSYFGEFGQQGYGYNVRSLFAGISSVLGVTDEFSAVILGNGDMAKVIAGQPIFLRRGVILKGIFMFGGSDNIKKMQPRDIVERIEIFLDENPADILVLCDFCGLDEYVLSKICSKHNIAGIWNFTERELDKSLFSGIEIKTIFFCDSLMTLCHAIKQRKIMLENAKNSKTANNAYGTEVFGDSEV